MSFGYTRTLNGLQLIGQNTISPSEPGDIRYNSSTTNLEYFNNSLRILANLDEAQTFTNKIIDGTLNTLINVPAGSLNLTGSITSADINGQLSIAVGGTGQSTQTTAFNALSPLTTKGDIVVYNGTNNIRLPVGTNSQVLTADSSQASGLIWSNSAVANNSITEFKLTTSVAGNGLTGGNGTPLSVVVDNSTIQITGNTLSVKSQGITATQILNNTITASQIANTTITATQIANATITGTQVSSNINLPGNAVKENGQNIIVSNTNASTSSLCIVRGNINPIGGPVLGEGYTSSHGTPGVVTITFTTPFAEIPVVVTSCQSGAARFSRTNDTPAPSSSAVTITCYESETGNATDTQFNFIAIGQRA